MIALIELAWDCFLHLVEKPFLLLPAPHSEREYVAPMLALIELAWDCFLHLGKNPFLPLPVHHVILERVAVTDEELPDQIFESLVRLPLARIFAELRGHWQSFGNSASGAGFVARGTGRLGSRATTLHTAKYVLSGRSWI